MKAKKFQACSDAVYHRWTDGTWVLSNPRAHRHVEMDAAAMAAFTRLSAGAPAGRWSRALAGGRGRVRTAFTNAAGLLADPTGCGPARGPWLKGAALLEALAEARLIMTSSADYQDFLRPQTSLLDNGRLGTFHQAVGRHLLLRKRLKNSWRWWHDQKFDPDGRGLRPGPYRWIQGHFFDRYFGGMDMAGLDLLDFACGNGYYAARFAARGARVLGVDTSEELIALAEKNFGGKVKFVRPENPAASLAYLAALPRGRFDRIYMADALLFFFHDIKSGGEGSSGADALLKEFRRLLKPGGRLYLMEPNGTFWLASRLGAPPRPLAAVAEYRERTYHVAPTSDRVIEALSRAGFLVSRLIHPEIDPRAEKIDPAAHAFGKAFPLWDFYVCVPGR